MKRLLLAIVVVGWILAYGTMAQAQPAPAPGGAETPAAAPAHHDEHHSSFNIWKVLILQTLAVLIILALLKKFVLPIISKGLDDKIASIKNRYETLDRDKAEVHRLQKAIQDRLAGIEAEAKAKVEAAIRDGQAQKASILADAAIAADKILAKAKGEISVELAKAIEEIRQEMVQLSLAAAERIVREKLTPARQEELIEKFIVDLEKVRA